MTRYCAALLLMLALSLQGVPVAVAAVHPEGRPDCHGTLAGASQAACCATGDQLPAGCCAHACGSTVAHMTYPAPIFAFSRTRPPAATPRNAPRVVSRADAPLIRPPIL